MLTIAITCVLATSQQPTKNVERQWQQRNFLGDSKHGTGTKGNSAQNNSRSDTFTFTSCDARTANAGMGSSCAVAHVRGADFIVICLGQHVVLHTWWHELAEMNTRIFRRQGAKR